MASEIPSKTLFIAEIPPHITEQQFQDLFSGYSGFKEARLRRDKNNNIVGFVEFENESCAGLGKAALQSYKWSSVQDKGLLIQFGRTDNTRKIRRSDRSSPNPTHNLNQLPSLNQNRRNREFTQDYNPVMPTPTDATSSLFVEGLPLDATEREVAHIFRRMPGYQSLRIIPKEVTGPHARTYNLCFVEFDNKYQATSALHNMQGYRMEKDDPRTGLSLSFAKKRKKNHGTTGNQTTQSQNNNNDNNNQNQTNGPTTP